MVRFASYNSGTSGTYRNISTNYNGQTFTTFGGLSTDSVGQNITQEENTSHDSTYLYNSSYGQGFTASTDFEVNQLMFCLARDGSITGDVVFEVCELNFDGTIGTVISTGSVIGTDLPIGTTPSEITCNMSSGFCRQGRDYIARAYRSDALSQMSAWASNFGGPGGRGYIGGTKSIYDNLYFKLTGKNASAQTAFLLEDVQLRCYRTGSKTGNITVGIYEVNDYNRTQFILGNLVEQITYPFNSLGTVSGVWVTFPFSGTNLMKSGCKYAVVLRFAGATGTQYVNWEYSIGGYSSGETVYTPDFSSWTYGSDDMSFRIEGSAYTGLSELSKTSDLRNSFILKRIEDYLKIDDTLDIAPLVNLLYGLQRYYKFDETSGTTAIDATGNSNGSYSGAYTLNQSGKINTSVSFNGGTSSYMSFTAPTISDSISISLWFKTTNALTSRQFLASNNTQAIEISDPTTITWYPDVTTSSVSATVPTCNDGNWHNVIITQQGTDFEIWFDGILENSGTTVNLNTGTFTSRIADYAGVSAVFRGWIDEVGIWTKKLNLTEVSRLNNDNNGLAYPFTSFARVFSDTAKLSASIVKEISRRPYETLKLTGTTTNIKGFFRELADALKLTDSPIFKTTRILSDTAKLVEDVDKSESRNVSDTLKLTATPSKQPGKNLSETGKLTDVRGATQLFRTIPELMKLTDDFSKSFVLLRTYSENMKLQENLPILQTFGTGADGDLIFTTTTKSYGNLIINTDYTVSGNTLYLKTNRQYNFSNMQLGAGCIIQTVDTNGAVIYINCVGTAIIDGSIIAQAPFGATSSSIQINGVLYSTPGIAKGGSGGDSASILNSYSQYWAPGTGGTDLYNLGYGGGGGGGPATIDASFDGFETPGNGANGGTPISGGTKGIADGPTPNFVPATSGMNSGGGGGAAVCEYDDAFDTEGGAGGGTYGAAGGNATSAQGGPIGGHFSGGAGGGGGGAGGSAGASGLHFVLRTGTANISSLSNIYSSGINGGNGGKGGNGVADKWSSSSIYNENVMGAGGGGGGGGGGGNAGNVSIEFFNGQVLATIIAAGGLGGSGGAKGTSAKYNGDGVTIDEGSAAVAGSNGTNGSSGTVSLGANVRPQIYLNRNLLDTLKLLSTLISKSGYGKVLTEIALFADSLSKSQNKNLLDVLKLSDSYTSIANLNRTYSDTLKLIDTISKSDSRSIFDTLKLSAIENNGPGKNLSDTLKLTDDLLAAFIKILSEIVKLSDTISRVCLRQFSEVSKLVDVRNADVYRELEEYFILTDLVERSKVLYKTLSDVLKLNANLDKSIIKRLNETAKLLENIIKNSSRELSELALLSDLRSSFTGKNIVENILLSDNVTKFESRSLSDVLKLSETISKSSNKLLSEITKLVDTENVSMQRLISETIVLIDELRGAKTLVDLMKVSDQISRNLSRLLSETIKITDDRNAQSQRTVTENILLSEVLSKQDTKALADIVKLVDTKKFSTSRLLTDTAKLGDLLLKLESRLLIDTLKLSDGISKQPKKVATENLKLTDIIATFTQYYRTLLDTAKLTAVKYNAPMKGLSDALKLTDAKVSRTTRNLGDTLTLTQEITKFLDRSLLEEMFLGPDFGRTTRITISNTIALSDYFRASLGFLAMLATETISPNLLSSSLVSPSLLDSENVSPNLVNAESLIPTLMNLTQIKPKLVSASNGKN